MYFYCETDKGALGYKAGEEMKFTLTLREDGKTVCPDGVIKYKIEADGKAGSVTGELPASSPAVITAKCDIPGFVRLTATLYDKRGEKVAECGNFDGGAGADVGYIRAATPYPADFDEYRARLLTLSDSVAPTLIEKKELPSAREGFKLYDIKVASAGNAPVSGYLTVPDGDAKFKCKVGYKGYGVTYPEPEYEDGTAYLFTNAHGFENGREPEYYASLAAGALKDYGMSRDENARPETSYFYGMILRAVAALKFMTTLDRWDGENLIAYGGSQGGMQAMNAASLYYKCTECDVFVPWMCDVAAKIKGRIRYAAPPFARGLCYFDGVNTARHIKCKTTVRAGLGDYTCQPSGITAMFNALGCESSIVFRQNMIHTSAEPEGAEFEMNKAEQK